MIPQSIQHIKRQKSGLALPAGVTIGGEEAFLQLFIKWTWIFSAIAGVLQIGIWPTAANIFAVAAILVCWRLITFFILRYNIFSQHPLSCFMVLGLGLSQGLFPLLFTLLDFHRVTYNLNEPFLVFMHAMLAVLVVVCAHLFYRQQLKRKPLVYRAVQRQLLRIGLFTPPTNTQIWIMGWTGLIPMFYVYFYSPSVGNDISGAGNKFIQGFVPFTYAPFFLLIRKMFSLPEQRSKKLMIQLGIFVILLFVVSIGRNSRGAFMFGFTGLVFGYFVGLLLGFFSYKVITRKNLVILGIIFWLVNGPLSDLRVAMVIVRGQRSETDRIELMKLTLEKYQNKAELDLYKASTSGKDVAGWDEQYLSNIFLARLCNMKFSDASLEISEKLGGPDPEITAYAIERPLAIFPQPVIDLLGLDVDKTKVNSSSSGDVLFDRVGGGNALGGFRVGHFAGFGMASFGWFYLLFLFILIIPVFFLWDLLALKVKSATSSGKSRVLLSLAALLSMTDLFQFFNFENVLYIIQFLVRGWIQIILLYWVLLQMSKWASGIFIKR